ncbi:MAG: hypothetical protein WCP34_09240 [Pseudomonadota bacterium]
MDWKRRLPCFEPCRVNGCLEVSEDRAAGFKAGDWHGAFTRRQAL